MRIKNIFCMLLTFILFIGALTIPMAAEEDIKVLLNGEALTFDVSPQIINDHTMVPMRVIFEALEAKVEWYNEQQSIKATKNNIEIWLYIDKNLMQIITTNFDSDSHVGTDSVAIELDSPPVLVNGRALVPLSAIVEFFGATIEWDDETKTCFITEHKNEIADDWILYISNTEKGKLYKIDTNGNNRQKLSDFDCYDLFYLDGWVYFYTWSNKGALYRVDINGQEQQQLTEERMEVNTIKDNIMYYVKADGYFPENNSPLVGNLYKMDLNDRKEIKLTDDLLTRWTVELSGNIIYYETKNPTSFFETGELYCIDIHGENKKKLSSDEFKPGRFNKKNEYSSDSYVMDDYIIYRAKNGKFSEIRAVNIDDTNDRLVVEGKPYLAFDFVKNGRLYYHFIDTVEAVLISGMPTQRWSCNLDGTDHKKLFDGTTFIKSYGDRIYYQESYLIEDGSSVPWNGLYSVDLEGENQIVVTKDKLNDFVAVNNKIYAVSFSNNNLYKYDLSEQSKTLLVNEDVSSFRLLTQDLISQQRFGY